MRLTLFTALSLALLSSMIPGCNRTATDAEEAASKGGASGKTPQGGTTGEASKGTTSK
jgi:hypothetical protein